MNAKDSQMSFSGLQEKPKSHGRSIALICYKFLLMKIFEGITNFIINSSQLTSS